MMEKVLVLGRRAALPLLAAAVAFSLWLALPQPVPGLWPPAAPDEKHLVYVTLKGYHTALDFPDHRFGLFQEWDMGAAIHYLDRDPEYLWKIVKAFFRPLPATVRFNLFVRPYWHRMNLPEETVYTFWLSPAGKAALEAYLHRMRGPKVKFDGEFHLFACTRPWTPLSNCNGFIGGALRAAGLPIREALALEGTTMRCQLERCRRFQDEWLAAGGFRLPNTSSPKEKSPESLVSVIPPRPCEPGRPRGLFPPVGPLNPAAGAQVPDRPIQGKDAAAGTNADAVLRPGPRWH